MHVPQLLGGPEGVPGEGEGRAVANGGDVEYPPQEELVEQVVERNACRGEGEGKVSGGGGGGGGGGDGIATHAHGSVLHL